MISVMFAVSVGLAAQAVNPALGPPITVENRTLPPRVAPQIPTPQPTRTTPSGRTVVNGLPVEGYGYEMPAGITVREVVFYSEGVACYGKIFFPKGFDPKSKPGVPAVVLGQGYAGTHFSIEKYAARMAQEGLVAMAIDYRGWGLSDGYVQQMTSTVGGTLQRDETRFEEKTIPVRIKRTPMSPPRQQEDYRNAISYLQGEPGVNPERIGVWGSSQAGGNAVAVAGRDARAKVIAVQIPGMGGTEYRTAPVLRGPALANAIAKARTGVTPETIGGFSRNFALDCCELEQNPTLFWASKIGARPLLVVVGEDEELIRNEVSGKAAFNAAQGPKEYIEVKGVSHFEMYTKGFKESGDAAAKWFAKYLNAPEAADPPPPPPPAPRAG